jgi:HK97 family phage portal protein
MKQSNKHIGLPARLLKAVAKPFGLDVVRRERELSSSLMARIFRMIGLSTYSWSYWDNEKFVREGYLGNADLYAIVNRITSTAAIAPFKVFRVKDQKKLLKYKQWTGERATAASIQKAILLKNQVFEEDNTHALNLLIERPNHWQGCNEFTQASIGFKLITGNRFWFVNELDAGANAGRPHGVFNLPPQYMTIIIGSTLWTVKGYELNLGHPQPIPPESIIHSRYWNPEYDLTGSHLWGLSPLRAASRTLDRSNKAEQRGTTMLDNAGAAGVMFDKGGSKLTVEQAQEMKRKLNEEVLGLDNSGRISLANGDIGYINFGLSAVEMEILKQEEFSMQRLANIYKAPAGLFLANANATDNNIAAWNKQLVTQAVIPALSELRDDWNKIAQKYEENIYVDYDVSVFPELQDDIEKTAKVMAQAWWYNGNEKRLAMGADEDSAEPMMKKYLVPGTLREISDLNPDAFIDELDRETDENM